MCICITCACTRITSARGLHLHVHTPLHTSHLLPLMHHASQFTPPRELVHRYPSTLHTSHLTLHTLPRSFRTSHLHASSCIGILPHFTLRTSPFTPFTLVRTSHLHASSCIGSFFGMRCTRRPGKAVVAHRLSDQVGRCLGVSRSVLRCK